MIDYHVHTKLCNHAKGMMNQYISNAIQLNFKEICFLEHITLKRGATSLSMSPNEVPFYFQAVQDFKFKYNGIINIKCGLEIDFNPNQINLIKNLIKTFSFDVIGSSVHFVHYKNELLNLTSRKSAHKILNIDPDILSSIYLEELDNMLNYNYFDIVCHLDVFKKYCKKNKKNIYNNFNEIIKKISYKKKTIEINTSGYNHPAGDLYPAENLIQQCYKLGVNISLGSDAHIPEEVGRHYEKVLPMLKQNGFKYLSGYLKRQSYPIFL